MRKMCVVFVFVLLAFTGLSVASPPANTCPEPCYVCNADGVTCEQRWWQDLDTYTLKQYPVQISRGSAGNMWYDQCQVFGDGSLSPWCGGIVPMRITLREWCGRMMRLPVPPRINPTDSIDFYHDQWVAGGVCP